MPDIERRTDLQVSRRRFLSGGGMLLASGALAACSMQEGFRRNCEGKGLKAGTAAFDRCLAQEQAIIDRMGRSRRSGGP